MKTFLTLAAVSLLALGACTPEPTMDKPTGLDLIKDKRLVGGDGTVFLINSDGSVGGLFRGEAPIVGSYTENDGEICSTYTEPENFRDLKVCSVPDVTGNTVVFNRRNGSQSQPYTIGG